MFGLLKSVTNLAKDAIDIVSAPVEVAVDLTRTITKPIADTAKEVVKEVKETINDDHDPLL